MVLLQKYLGFLKKYYKRFCDSNSKGEFSSSDINIRFIGSRKPSISVGVGSYVNGMDVYCWDERVNFSIGKYCSVADRVVVVLGGEHDKDWVSTYPFIDRLKLKEYEHFKRPRYKGDVVIGHDVWIANNVTILSGVCIGNGAVIGAGSVVTKDVPDYAVFAGNPAKHIKNRFPDNVVADLLGINWWDWSEDEIIRNFKFFTSPDEFIKEFKK